MRHIYLRGIMLILAGFFVSCSPQTETTDGARDLKAFYIVEDSAATEALLALREELYRANWLDGADEMVAQHQEQLELTQSIYGDQDYWTEIATNNLGVAHVIAGDPQLAVPLFERALSALGTETSEIAQDHIYRLHSNLGEAFLRLDDLSSAKTHFDFAVANPSLFKPAIVPEISSGQRMMMVLPRWQAEYEREPGNVLIAEGVVPSAEARAKAMENYWAVIGTLHTAQGTVIRNAMTAYHDAMVTAHHPRARFITSSNGNMAVILSSYLFDPTYAVYFAKAEENEARLGTEIQTDVLNVSTSMQSAVKRLAASGDFEAAAAKIVELEARFKPLFESNPYLQSGHHTMLGDYHALRGEQDVATEHYRLAYEILRDAGNFKEMLAPYALGAYANHLSTTGHHTEAERYFETAIAEASELTGTDSTLISHLRLGYAISLQDRGAYARSKIVLEQNLLHMRQGENEQHAALPPTYAALSRSLLNLGEPKVAVQFAERAFEVAKSFVPEDALTFDTYIHTLALAHDTAGNYEKANALLEKRRTSHQDIPKNSRNNIAHLEQLSRHYRAAGDFEKAVEMDDAIVSALQGSDTLDLRFNATSARLRSLKVAAGANPADAKTSLFEAVGLIESFPATNADGVFAFGQGMTPTRRDALSNFGHIAVSANDTRRVFETMQAFFADGVGYATRLARERELSGNPKVSALLRQRDALQTERSRLRLEQFSEITLSSEDRLARVEQRGRLDEELTALNRDLQDAAQGTEATITVAGLRKTLAPNEVVLFIHDAIPATLVISHDKVATAHFSLSPNDTSRLVSAIRQSVTADGAGRFPPFAAEEASRLYDAIFTPEITDIISGVDTIYVQQGGRISTLPLGLLIRPDGQYMSDNFALRTMAGLNRIGQAAKPVSGRFVGIGAPLLGTPEPARGGSLDAYILRGAAKLENLSDLPALPGAERELNALSTAFDFDDVTLLIGAAATKTAVRSLDYQNTAVLAFATHGLVAGELDSTSEPALVLTPDDNGNEGLLTMSDVMKLDLDVDLVILSACNTAAGGEADAAGLTGLASAFIYAGVDTLLASHWPVRDDVAEALSIATIGNIRRGETAEHALQRAIAELRNSDAPQSDHPGVWAPFIVVGG